VSYRDTRLHFRACLHRWWSSGHRTFCSLSLRPRHICPVPIVRPRRCGSNKDRTPRRAHPLALARTTPKRRLKRYRFRRLAELSRCGISDTRLRHYDDAQHGEARLRLREAAEGQDGSGRKHGAEEDRCRHYTGCTLRRRSRSTCSYRDSAHSHQASHTYTSRSSSRSTATRCARCIQSAQSAASYTRAYRVSASASGVPSHVQCP
jgi:hypothetical protein